jgi:hypothetical protein
LERDPRQRGYLIAEAAVVTESPRVVAKSADTISILAVLQEADAPNRNRRLYEMPTLTEAIASPYIRERVRTKTFYGEAGHPLKPDMERQLYIDHLRISHIVLDPRFEGKLLKSVVESANTVVGRDFKGLIEQGSDVAFSMRGIG